MKLLSKILLITVSVLIVYALGKAGMIIIAHQEFAERFDALKRGVHKDVVRNTFGPPTSMSACGDSIWWRNENSLSREPNAGKCTEWWRYGEVGSLSAYGVGFDKNGTVISKYAYVSE